MSTVITISRPTKDNSFSITVLVTLFTIITIAAAVGMIGMTVSFCYGALFLAALQVTAMVVCGILVLCAVAGWVWSFFRRGRLLCDCGPNPYRKLFISVAILNIVPALFSMDAARRSAELTPIRQRIDSQLAERNELLHDAKESLNEQNALLEANDTVHAQRFAELAQISIERANELSMQIDSDIAERTRLSNQIMPDSESIELINRQLHTAFTGSNIWSTLSSHTCFQFVVGLMMLAIGLTNGAMSMGRTQLRESGLWQASTLRSWKHIASYHWAIDGKLELTFHHSTKPLSLVIPVGQRAEVTEVLAKHIAWA